MRNNMRVRLTDVPPIIIYVMSIINNKNNKCMNLIRAPATVFFMS